MEKIIIKPCSRWWTVRGLALDIVVYSMLQAVVTLSLVMLGETRVDVYVSLSILVYFVATSILPNIREKSSLRVLDVFLVMIFMLIVTVRVAEILGYSIPGMAK